MRSARGDADAPRDSAGRRVLGGGSPSIARPAWWILGCAIGIAMTLWATGILEVSASQRRLVDWIGGLTVLSALVTWVRSNARTLAVTSEPLDRHEGLQIRVIRSRRPPLAAVAGAEIIPLRRRPRRARSS